MSRTGANRSHLCTPRMTSLYQLFPAMGARCQRYNDDPEGRRLEYKDNLTKHKAHLRCNNLVRLGDTRQAPARGDLSPHSQLRAYPQMNPPSQGQPSPQRICPQAWTYPLVSLAGAATTSSQGNQRVSPSIHHHRSRGRLSSNIASIRKVKVSGDKGRPRSSPLEHEEQHVRTAPPPRTLPSKFPQTFRN